MLLKKFLGMSRQKKIFLMLILDFLLLPLSLWSAVGLRTDHWALHTQYPIGIYFMASLVAIPVFIKMGLYRSVVRYMEDRAILTIIAAVTISIVIFGSLIFFLGLSNVPRGALLIYWLLATVYIVCSRFLARAAIRMLSGIGGRRHGNKVVIYGAGDAGRQLAVALRTGPDCEPAAFVDDDPAKHGLNIGGIKVYGSAELPRLIRRLGIEQVLLAIPSLPRSRRIEIVNRLEPLAVQVRVVPGMAELISGEAHLYDVREVDIDELLGREVVVPNTTLLMKNIAGKNVMVTGAGGSIGSELCRQIIKNQPARLVLYEQSEFALYSLEYELQQIIATKQLPIELIPVLGSVQNGERAFGIMARYGVQTIYHAAAYKHVPIVEFNMTEGVLNNTLGTNITAEAAIRANVETFVLISTDKAVRPTNVMGASKRMAELCLQAFAQDPAIQTRFSIVRFGNVLGSSGSVVPLFKKQIASGGPVTVTHPDIIRYFMTIPEAAQLVIQAGTMGGSGEVFVLDMGAPVKIVDLARRMIHLSGFEVKDEQNPDGDIAIEFTGLRPGEKLYEELLIGDAVEGTSHPRIMKANESFLTRSLLEEKLHSLIGACLANDCETLQRVFLECVSGFRPDCEIKDHLYPARGNVAPLRLLH
ncbi:Capsular polysaccharide biosynthesis protein CapD [Cupriavidus taiwanensis]|uniref:polysaccharide biosynthesis protein n=1 Tax=Cupriavidus taiwanensis TaxID=164546 RepID=UPI000E184933|nr:nucleoside-diphosphate sugar epimerase/dehydratase [Cupriavidus taiwanensis]SOY82794.1 Capsular polysaccharide biosynthesis protein CapD [Cupriavidus taiwanensis]SOY84562.1 Capsular polysaccharide biosynthesis protein CapD [Cupriavidus taiwanensis]